MVDATTRLSTPQRALDALRSDRSATIAHYASLVVGFATVAFIARTQWFFYDEWRFMWEPAETLWGGHAGHWSTVPVLVWMALQAVFGLSSYWPFLLLEILTHVIAAHLLWRLLNRVGSARWVSTGLVAVFLVLGAGAENLLWGFQFGYIGAIACGLGAVLIALRPGLGVGGVAGVTALLLVGAATSGTALPLFVPVALVVWRMHGWRKLMITVGVPMLAYLSWYFAIAGPNGNAYLRATGAEILLVPQYMGFMFVEGLGRIIPLPYIGAVIVALIGLWTLRSLGRKLTAELLAAIGMVGAGVVFAAMTGYSRWGTSLASASSNRYVYFLFVALAAAVALMVTRAIAASDARLLLALGLVAFVGIYNLGTLVTTARSDAVRENFGHQAISAGIALAEEFPSQIDLEASPEPVYVTPSISALQTLHERDGLPVIEFSDEARLTALVNLGVTVARADEPARCTPVGQGTVVPSGSVLDADGSGAVWIAAVDDDGRQGQPRELEVKDGAYTVETLDGSSLIITGPPNVPLCVDGEATTS
ncbi:hypothetical protein ACI3KY_10580 [Microbacterium sp. ZW T2_14]|uniref:hypothetical protein n=1 Tax=Microbacterium sp. ZW T2_14 TaxID=3378079 RepID=UPI003851DFF4